MTHLELFAGIGGFRRAIDLVCHDMGMSSLCVGYSEIDAKAHLTYNVNYDTTKEIDMGDIVSFTSDENNIKRLPDFDLLTGGFPCQPFSMMGKQEGFNEERGQMFFRIWDILKIKKPRYVLLENVKNLKTHNNNHTFKRIKSELEELGYNVAADVFNTADYQLPQTRNRVLIFATLDKVDNLEFLFTAEKVKETFKEKCNNASLNRYDSVLDILCKDVDEKYYLSERVKPTILSNGTGGYLAKSEINLRIARPLTATMHKMHRACQDNYYSEEFIKSNGQSNDSRLPFEDLCKLRIRKLTPEEAFMLQGFPSGFATNGRLAGVANGALYKQAGNAVSVNTIYAVLYFLIVSGLIKEKQ